MSEGIWSIETDDNAVWLVKAVLEDVGTQEAALVDEMTAQKKKLLNMECGACNGKTPDEDDILECQDQIQKTEMLIRKLSEKRQYFEDMLCQCEQQAWRRDDDPE